MIDNSQSQLWFKSRFEHIWQFDLKYKDSIYKIAISFEIWFEIFVIRFEKDLNRDAIVRARLGVGLRTAEALLLWVQFNAETALCITDYI